MTARFTGRISRSSAVRGLIPLHSRLTEVGGREEVVFHENGNGFRKVRLL